MTSTLLNRTTATKENALTDEERDAFLAEKRIGRLATQREDGWPHVTPIWYVWEEGRFFLTLGKSRRHLRNIAADPHVTMCVDDDPRMTDLTKAPRSVVCFGLATLVEDEQTVREATRKVEDGISRAPAGPSSRRCSGSKGGRWSRSNRSTGSPGTRVRGSPQASSVIATRSGGVPRTSTAPDLGRTRRTREKSGRRLAERIRADPHVPRADGLEAVALDVGRLARFDVAHAEVQREAVEELEQLVVAAVLTRIAAELRLLLGDERLDLVLHLRRARERRGLDRARSAGGRYLRRASRRAGPRARPAR